MSRGGNYSGNNRRGGIAIAPHAHPLVRMFLVAMNHQQTTFAEVAERTHVGIDTMRFWQGRHMPRLDLFDAALNALDLELVIRPIGTRARDLKRIEQETVERAFKVLQRRAEMRGAES